MVTSLSCEFWISMLDENVWDRLACTVVGVAVTVIEVGFMNSIVASEDDLEPPDHVAVIW